MTAHKEEMVVEARDLEAPTALGELMSQAREANGLSVEEIAAELKLPPAVLDALERGDHEHLPPPAFVRGYLRSFGRLLQVPSEQLVAAYKAVGVAEADLVATSEIRAQSNSGDPLVRWATYAIVALMVIMAGLWWKTQWESQGGSPGESPDNPEIADAQFAEGQPQETVTPETFTEGLDAPPPALELDPAVDGRSLNAPDRLGELDLSAGEAGPTARADSNLVTPDPQIELDTGQIELDTGAMTPSKVSESAETVEPAVAVIETSSQDPARTLEAPVEAATVEPPIPASPSAPPTANKSVSSNESASLTSETTDSGAAADTTVSSTILADQDELVLTTASQSWGEIYDADGKRLLFNMLESPAPRRFRGRSPFRVFLGNSPEVHILFNGAPVEQSRFNRRNNTARFVIASDGLSRQ